MSSNTPLSEHEVITRTFLSDKSHDVIKVCYYPDVVEICIYDGSGHWELYLDFTTYKKLGEPDWSFDPKKAADAVHQLNTLMGELESAKNHIIRQAKGVDLARFYEELKIK